MITSKFRDFEQQNLSRGQPESYFSAWRNGRKEKYRLWLGQGNLSLVKQEQKRENNDVEQTDINKDIFQILPLLYQAYLT